MGVRFIKSGTIAVAMQAVLPVGAPRGQFMAEQNAVMKGFMAAFHKGDVDALLRSLKRYFLTFHRAYSTEVGSQFQVGIHTLEEKEITDLIPGTK